MSGTPSAKSIPVNANVVQPVAIGELFDSKQQIESSHTSELVIALCGPIGSPLHKVASAIKARLEHDFAYQSCTILRLSTVIERYTANVQTD